MPGGTQRNFDSYGHLIAPLTNLQRDVLCDPQTSGGLLIAVQPDAVDQVTTLAAQHGIALNAIGRLIPQQPDQPLIDVIE